jgi:cobalt/nickel transport system permease protein
LHHVVVERWSRGSSPLHRRDARAKITALLVFLVVVATAHRDIATLAALLLALLAAAAWRARLPAGGALARAALVLPFTAVFGAVCWLAGDPARGLALVLKSYLSALAVLLLVATTPLPKLLRGLEGMGAPHFLLMVAQFLYRYLFVISEEAQHMRKAAAARAPGWGRAGRGARFRAAAGALAVLFARSYGHAEEIHRAMLARGFGGVFHPLEAPRFGPRDAAFLACACALPVALRLCVERLA